MYQKKGSREEKKDTRHSCDNNVCPSLGRIQKATAFSCKRRLVPLKKIYHSIYLPTESIIYL